MTERDYMLAVNIARVYAMQDMHRRIYVMDGLLPSPEFHEAYRILDRWRERLEAAINEARGNEEED